MFPAPILNLAKITENSSQEAETIELYQDQQYKVNMMVSQSPFIFEISKKIQRVSNYFSQLNQIDLDSLDSDKRKEVVTAYVYAYAYLAGTLLGTEIMTRMQSDEGSKLKERIKGETELSNILRYAEPDAASEKKFSEIREISEGLILKFESIGIGFPIPDRIINAIKEMLTEQEYLEVVEGEGRENEVAMLNVLKLVMAFSTNMNDSIAEPVKYLELVKSIASYTVDLKIKQMRYHNPTLTISMRTLRAFVNGYNEGIELVDENSRLIGE